MLYDITMHGAKNIKLIQLFINVSNILKDKTVLSAYISANMIVDDKKFHIKC
jgi:hypothetical protein